MAEKETEIGRRAALITDSIVAEATGEGFDTEQIARRFEDYSVIIQSEFPASFPASDNLVRLIINTYVMGFLRGIIWTANSDIDKRKANSLINELENLRTKDYSNG